MVLLKERVVKYFEFLQRMHLASVKKAPWCTKWGVALARQLPLSLFVSRLSFPYFLFPPFLFISLKTWRLAHLKSTKYELYIAYFKILSRFLFGLSIRKFLEQAARGGLSVTQNGTGEWMYLLSLILLVICVFIDASEFN